MYKKNFKLINSILLIILLFDSIQSKCISNVTIGTTSMTLKDESTELTTTGPIFGNSCQSIYQIIPNSILNQQAFKDFKITIITQIKLQAVKSIATCACAKKCQYTTYCRYFESYTGSFDNTCLLHQFNTPITQLLKNNLQRGIYYDQLYNMACGLPNILFS